MRKNRMMRAASALLVAVLLTTSTISGTFAKYVTTASGSDTARVAHWGVEVTGMADTLFAKEYDGTVKVGTVDVKDLVAPGTENDTGVTFGLKGQPEVDVQVDFVVKSSTGDKAVDVYLPAGTYVDYTTVTATATDGTVTYGNNFTVADPGYYPVVFTLKNGAGDILVQGKLSEVETFLEGLSDTYDANTDLATVKDAVATPGKKTDGVYKLTWAWAYGVFDGISEADKADTYLGNVIANTPAGIVKDNISTAIDLEIAVTVTQID